MPASSPYIIHASTTAQLRSRTTCFMIIRRSHMDTSRPRSQKKVRITCWLRCSALCGRATRTAHPQWQVWRLGLLYPAAWEAAQGQPPLWRERPHCRSWCAAEPALQRRAGRYPSCSAAAQACWQPPCPEPASRLLTQPALSRFVTWT